MRRRFRYEKLTKGCPAMPAPDVKEWTGLSLNEICMEPEDGCGMEKVFQAYPQRIE